MSKVEAATVEFVLPESLKPIADIASRYLAVSADAALEASDNKAMTDEILATTKYNYDDLVAVQDLTAKVGATLLYVGYEKAHAHIENDKEVARVAGKISWGNNEMAFSLQPQLKENNADGTPKAPVVSVISRQYECEEYRDIRKHIIGRARSLRD